jgi:hypothetical protein
LDESICPHDAEIEAFFNKFLVLFLVEGFNWKGVLNVKTSPGPTPFIDSSGGCCERYDTSLSVMDWSEASVFGAIVTLLPSGRVMVPPDALPIGWVTVAIVPATMRLNEADFAVSTTLVAFTDTV